jgi:hypothetical protein
MAFFASATAVSIDALSAGCTLTFIFVTKSAGDFGSVYDANVPAGVDAILNQPFGGVKEKPFSLL